MSLSGYIYNKNIIKMNESFAYILSVVLLHSFLIVPKYILANVFFHKAFSYFQVGNPKSYTHLAALFWVVKRKMGLRYHSLPNLPFTFHHITSFLFF